MRSDPLHGRGPAHGRVPGAALLIRPVSPAVNADVHERIWMFETDPDESFSPVITVAQEALAAAETSLAESERVLAETRAVAGVRKAACSLYPK